MNEPIVSIPMPAPLYRRLKRLSELTHRPMESLVLQTLDTYVPRLPEDLPTDVRAALAGLEKLNDDTLWQIANSKVSSEDQSSYSGLAERKQRDTLTENEETTLEQLYQEGNQLMLKKAYATAILKWREYPLPSLAELEARG